MAKIEGSCAEVEFVALNSKTLHQGDEEIAERHVFSGLAARVDMADMIESSPGNENGKIAVRVRAAVAHSAAKEDDGVV